jgi:hypothetical protein
MKSILIGAVLCICSSTLSAQLNLSKEIKVQNISGIKKITLDCNSRFLAPKPEYKPFVDYMKRPPLNSIIQALNFHIKYVEVTVVDSAIHTGSPGLNNTSLTADFMVFNQNCNSIVGERIPFTGLDYSSEDYNVSLATNLGILTFTNINTGKSKRFTLNPIGYGIYTGSINSTAAVKETVVVVLNRWRFVFPG